ncbi:MAG TPA: hypothetical protein VGA69_00830 [Nitriliruptorales bacterium]
MPRTTVWRRTFGAVAAVVALLVLSACDGTSGGGGVASVGEGADAAAAEDGEDAPPLDADAQALAFAECMREEGVDMPDPAPGQDGLREAFRREDVQDGDRATIEQALAACEDLLPQRDHGAGAGHDQERDEMMLELAECLREQGLDVPDDLFAGGAMHDVEDDELRAAMEECRDVAGGVRGGGH